jgi:hypothetical protein
MTDFTYGGLFDFIILPDVLEHIPRENHAALFGLLSKFMHDNSVLLIHIPHPLSLDFVRKNNPGVLQIIDQSIEADELIDNAFKHPLRLVQYKAYRLFHHQPDYVFIAFVRNRPLEYEAYSKWRIIYRKLIERIHYVVNNLF